MFGPDPKRGNLDDAVPFDDHNDSFDDEIDEDQMEMLEAEMNCSMGPDGQCGQAGSEYCDLECPFRD